MLWICVLANVMLWICCESVVNLLSATSFKTSRASLSSLYLSRSKQSPMWHFYNLQRVATPIKSETFRCICCMFELLLRACVPICANAQWFSELQECECKHSWSSRVAIMKYLFCVFEECATLLIAAMALRQGIFAWNLRGQKCTARKHQKAPGFPGPPKVFFVIKSHNALCAAHQSLKGHLKDT